MKKFLLSIVFVVIWLWFFSNIGNCDYLDDAFDQAKPNLILNDQNKSNNVLIGWEASFIVKWSQLLMQIAVWLGIFVVLFWWVKFMLTMWDETKMKENRDSMIMAIIWLIVVLSSYFILEVMQSVGEDYIQKSTTQTTWEGEETNYNEGGGSSSSTPSSSTPSSSTSSSSTSSSGTPKSGRCGDINCGNWSINYLEECDDGNNINGDGCNSCCQIE